jgi:MaoC like domain
MAEFPLTRWAAQLRGGTGAGRLVRRRDGDHQWIHADLERAAAGPFGGTVPRGFLTLSLAPVLVQEVLEVTDASVRSACRSCLWRLPRGQSRGPGRHAACLRAGPRD